MLQELGAAQGMDVSVVSLVSDGCTEGPETVRAFPLHSLRKMKSAAPSREQRPLQEWLTRHIPQHLAQILLSHSGALFKLCGMVHSSSVRPPEGSANVQVSSSAVRKALAEGRMEDVRRCLDRPYKLLVQLTQALPRAFSR